MTRSKIVDGDYLSRHHFQRSALSKKSLSIFTRYARKTQVLTDLKSVNFTEDTPVYIKVREHILSGRWKRGHILRPGDLATELRVSVSPVREALIRLSARGLVISMKNVGFSIPDHNLVATSYYCDILAHLYKESIRNVIRAGLLDEVAKRFQSGIRIISKNESVLLKFDVFIRACRGFILAKPYLSLASHIGDLVLAHQAVVPTIWHEEYWINEASAFAQYLQEGDYQGIDRAIEQHFARRLENIKIGMSQLTGLPYELASA